MFLTDFTAVVFGNDLLVSFSLSFGLFGLSCLMLRLLGFYSARPPCLQCLVLSLCPCSRLCVPSFGLNCTPPLTVVGKTGRMYNKIQLRERERERKNRKDSRIELKLLDL